MLNCLKIILMMETLLIKTIGGTHIKYSIEHPVVNFEVENSVMSDSSTIY